MLRDLLKKLVLFDRLDGRTQQKLSGMLSGFNSLVGGYKVEEKGGSIIVSKGKRSIIFAKREQDYRRVINNFDWFFSAKELEPHGDIIDFTKKVNFCGCRIETTLFGMLELETALKPYNRHYAIKPGDIVLDCGATCGEYAVYISKTVGPEGRIYCFEPDRANFAILKRNIEENGIRNMEPVNKGLWSEKGRLAFSADGTGTAHITGVGAAAGGKDEIEVTSLPEFFLEWGLKKIDFIKMDIEGAEIEVVGGALGFLKKNRANLAIASYHEVGGEKTCVKLERMLKSAGYAVATENPDHLTTYAW